MNSTESVSLLWFFLLFIVIIWKGGFWNYYNNLENGEVSNPDAWVEI